MCNSSAYPQAKCVCFLQAVSEQRLIYSGRLLPDHLHIKDLFKQVWKRTSLFVITNWCAYRPYLTFVCLHFMRVPYKER